VFCAASPAGIRVVHREQSADFVSPPGRSRIMRSVGQKNTRPERAVRAILQELGAHYRLSNRDLPGSPDIANRSRRWAIFVNGCFWHGHKNCSKTRGGKKSRVPVANREYWGPKFVENRNRDARKCRELRSLGFRVAIVWECELTEADSLARRLSRFLNHGTIL